MNFKKEKSNYYKENGQSIIGMTFTVENIPYRTDSVQDCKEYCLNIWIFGAGHHYICERKFKRKDRS